MSDITTLRSSTGGARLLTYRPWPHPNASLRGHCDIDFNGWQVSRIPVFGRDDGSLSVGTPSAPENDAEGRQRERDGKRQFWQVVTFRDRDARQRWERAVLTALSAAGIVP